MTAVCECGPAVLEDRHGLCMRCSGVVEHDAAPAWMVALTLALVALVVSLTILSVVGAV